MTSTAATAPSVHAVLSTTELLERILLAAPAPSIFQLQRVSTFFQETIESSISIRGKPFLEKDPSIPEAYWILDKNGLLDPVFASPAPAPIHPFSTYTRYVFNPLLLSQVPRQGRRMCPPGPRAIRVDPTSTSGPAIRDINIQQLATASCAQMFFTKPAATEMMLIIEWKGHALTMRPVENADGI